MDKPNAAEINNGVMVDGEMSDLHVRREHGGVAFCAVYVWPIVNEGGQLKPCKMGDPIRPGYWYEKSGAEAVALATRFA